MKKNTVLYVVLTTIMVLALTSIAADDSGRKLTAVLTGAEEVPGPGDPDGSGTATITLNLGQGRVCWEIHVSDIALPATAAHIHPGAAGVANPPIVTLSAPDASGHSSGCTVAERALIKDIMQNPETYYVNVHTLPDFGAGAVRGQLSK